MHLPPKATIIIGGALNVGCCIVGGLIIPYAIGEYDEFSGTAVQESNNTFRVKDANGSTSPSFTGTNGLKAGDSLTRYFLKPTCYITAPSVAPGIVAQRLWFSVAGIGGALLILSLLQPKKKQMVLGNVWRLIGVVCVIFGVVSGLFSIKDGLHYIPVTGTAEDAGNNKFRVRFPQGHVSQDIDIPANNPPRFGSPFTVFHADYEIVRSNKDIYIFHMLGSCITILGGVVGLVSLWLVTERVTPRVHPEGMQTTTVAVQGHLPLRSDVYVPAEPPVIATPLAWQTVAVRGQAPPRSEVYVQAEPLPWVAGVPDGPDVHWGRDVDENVPPVVGIPVR